MKPGQRIVFVDPRGKQHAATLIEITDAGPSHYKILTLEHGEDRTRVEAVPHAKDKEGSKVGYWLLENEVEEVPDRRAPIDKQPIMLSDAEAEGRLPSNERRASEQ